MTQQTWTITGTLRVQESELTEVATYRPLPNAEVEVFASNFGIYDSWGTVRTNSDGEFTLRKEKDKSKRKFKVQVRFADSELEINSGALSDPLGFLSPAIKVFEHSSEVEGPSINIGTRSFVQGNSGELGSQQNVRQAISWYVMKTVINTLQATDSYFDFNGKIKVIYPANVVSGTSYANGVTRCAYIHKNSSTDQWDVPTVLHEVMHLWNYDHNYGTSNWLAAVVCPPDWDTHSQEEKRPIAFHEGFAEYAAYGLLQELWGHEPQTRFERPKAYSRYGLRVGLGIHTADEVERNDGAVYRGLALLTGRALYKKVFGSEEVRQPTADGFLPAVLDSSNLSCPEPAELSVFDVLKVFQANAAAGWPTEWQVGDNEYGLYRFFHRAADVLSGLDEGTKDLMLDLLDPDSTVEPQDRCTAPTWQSHPVEYSDTVLVDVTPQHASSALASPKRRGRA